MDYARDISHESLVSRFLRRCANAWEAAGEAQEIAALDAETIREIAADCSIAPDDLLQLAKAGPHAADELPALMRQLQLDPDQEARHDPATFRAMQLACSRCGEKGRCRHDLAAHSSAQTFEHYCGNAPHLDALRAATADAAR